MIPIPQSFNIDASPLYKRHWGKWKKPAATSKMGLALTENVSYAVMCDPPVPQRQTRFLNLLSTINHQDDND